MTAIEKVIEIAANEVGYLEKKSNSNLYDKTANAGSGNYTKYWQDVAPIYQGQAWCACYITWCLTKAFGKDVASKMLGHYPYISCITGKSKAQQQGRWTSTPSVGAIIIFGNSTGTPSHTGMVDSFDNSKVYTFEGNTSGGSTVIANGGAVCKKSYSRSYSRILGYWNIDYSLAESEEFTVTQYEELKQLIASKDEIINTMGKEISEGKNENAKLKARIEKLENPMIYDYIDKNMPQWAHEAVQWCVNNGLITGTGDGLGLNNTKLWVCVVFHRAIKYIAKLINVKV